MQASGLVPAAQIVPSDDGGSNRLSVISGQEEVKRNNRTGLISNLGDSMVANGVESAIASI